MRVRRRRKTTIERARWHLWVTTFSIMAALVAAVVYLTGRTDGSAPLPLPTGNLRIALAVLVLGFLSYVVDRERNLRRLQERLTEERISSAQLATKLNEAKEVQALQRDFVSIVSHELRAPLTAIKGFAKTLLQRGDTLSPEVRSNFLTTVNEQSDRLARLVDDLLQVSKIDARRLSIEVVPVPLAQTVTDLLPQFRSKWDRAIDVDVPASLPSIAADKSKLEEVLINLIDNAVKYSPAESPIKVFARAAGGEVEVCVEDRGAGISPEDAAKLFQKFQRLSTPATRDVGGSGLGLYIVKGLVEAMGGRVWVESVPRAGSTFAFALPSTSPTRGSVRSAASVGLSIQGMKGA